MRLHLTRILPYVAVNKDAFPSNPAQPRRLHQINQPAKTSLISDIKVSDVKLQSQWQAFVHFAVGVAQLSKAIALNRTCVLEPFNRAGPRFENLASTRSIYGASDPRPML